MNYEKRAHGWYERALRENDEFVKFLLLFISLEVAAKLRQFDTLRKIKRADSIRNSFYSKIDRGYLSELKHQLDEKPHLNMKPSAVQGDHSWSGRLDSADDFGGIIEFLIRGRNNLFHGDKGLDEERDQFIVKAGTKILQPLVEAIIL
jgi:hypothetical protein